MVRVLRCHRFVSQNVVSTASEPTIICSDGNRLFISCDNYCVEEFSTDRDGCKKVRQFAAIGRVLQMVYSHEGEFLATIEEIASRSSASKYPYDATFRVYSNLEAISKGNPMKVRISGQVTRAKARRTGDVVDTSQLVVIEVPLKRPPTCIAAYAQNVAIAIKKTVLVYTCEKNADKTRDVRCVLELEFAFTVRRIELCEEFVMCSSGLECQIVQLNFDKSIKCVGVAPRPTNGSLNLSSFFEHPSLRSSSDSGALKLDHVRGDFDKNSKTLGSCQADAGNNRELCENCHKNNIHDALVGDESVSDKTSLMSKAVTQAAGIVTSDTGSSLKRHLVVRQAPISSCYSGPPSPPLPAPKPETKVKETAGGGLELLGPVSGELPTCAVYVEYEGTSKNSSEKCGVLKNGVTTLLYKKLEPYSHPFHSIQLLPVYLDEDVDPTAGETTNCVFVSERRKKLIGMFSVVSTPSFAFVYSLLSDCRLISSFSYAINTLQVRLTGSHLFAMSESRLDVYTARCLSRIIFHSEETGRDLQQTVPFVSEEPCLLGYHTFFDLTAMCQTGDYVTLLSKSSSPSRGSENSWSIYVLRRPDTESLYSDMVAQAQEWEKNTAMVDSSEESKQTSDTLTLIQEANMFLRSRIYLERSSSKKEEMISLLQTSCLYLAEVYQRHDVYGHVAVPYYLMAGYTLMDIVRKIQGSKNKISSRFRESLVWYARKLTGNHAANNVINELVNAGGVNGCLRKLRSIANAGAEVNPKSLQDRGQPESTKPKDEKLPASSAAEPGKRNSVTDFINADINTDVR